MSSERFTPDNHLYLGSLVHELEQHEGRLSVTYWGDTPTELMYALHLPHDDDKAEACREVAAKYGSLEPAD